MEYGNGATYSLFEDGLNPRIVTMAKFDELDSEIAIFDSYCHNPDCECRNVTLGFFEVVGDRKMEQLFVIEIDVDTWKLKKYQVLRKEINYKGMITKFLRVTDKKIRLKIKKRFESRKLFDGETLKENIDLAAIRKNQFMFYVEIFNTWDIDSFIFEHKGVKYFVFDSYCVNPKCDCNDVVLSFYKGDLSTEPISCYFSLKVKFKTGNYQVLEKSNAVNSKDITEIYNVFLTHSVHEDLKLIKMRYARVKKVRTALLLNDVNICSSNDLGSLKNIKIARNTPCPCGSGKNYQKCCGN